MIINESDYLAHYGVIRRSGRYPWGSGQEENTHNKNLLMYISELKKDGLSEKQIADGMHMSIKEMRAEKSRASNQQRQAKIATVQKLKDKGYSPAAISKRTGLPDSTVRSLLEPGAKDKADVLTSTANMLREQVAQKTYIDVGKGVENYVGVTATKLDTAVTILKSEGYELHSIKVPQLGTPHDTTFKVLCPPGTTWGELQKNRFQIQQITNYSEDGGRTYSKLHEPLTIDKKRVGVLYKGEGGEKADGMIYVRPGVKDVDIGGTSYAQVRIKVGNDHYIKGMAMYKDDLPAGVDLLFNTNKSNTGDKLDALKKISDNDPELPFGAVVRQILGNPGKEDEHVTSVVNIVAGNAAAERGNEEGTWSTWSRNLSSQMLSKQSPALAKSQLDMTYEKRQQQFDDVMALTNPTVRKKLLGEFADGTDSAAVHLRAAALPGQATHVILPLSNINPQQVFAPNYDNGTLVALVRYPHGGTFEIPELTVNNRNAEGTKLIGRKAKDAIGIHHSVAQQLSGADFDGDTVVVIPNLSRRVKATPALDELKNFDPVSAYPGYEGMKVMKNTQAEMGSISNLITDMTIHNAPPHELARAIKHSMVVIDAENKTLDHRLSYNDNGIKDLKEKYQRQPNGSAGAATLISRARSDLYIPRRKPRLQSLGGPIDPITGEKKWQPTNQMNKATGKPRKMHTTKLAETSNAFTLSSGTPMEALYATHANKLKGLANQARLQYLNTPLSSYSASAAKTYAPQVQSLNNKLDIALKNAPLERQAQLIANMNLKIKRDYNPDMDDDTKTKLKYQALEEARLTTGAGKQRIKVTPEEWDAIQAGAISSSKLTQVLNNADMEIIRELATPRTQYLMTSAKQARAEQMFALGYSRAEVADALGVSLTTLDTATTGVEE